MPKGDILVSPTHQFESDGEPHKKYFIQLSDPAKNGGYYVLVITTTQKKWRSDAQGCHPMEKGEGFYVLKARDDWFPAPTTWVLFEEVAIYIMNQAGFDAERAKNDLQLVEPLKDNNLKAIINCIARCPFVSGFKIDLIK